MKRRYIKTLGMKTINLIVMTLLIITMSYNLYGCSSVKKGTDSTEVTGDGQNQISPTKNPVSETEDVTQINADNKQSTSDQEELKVEDTSYPMQMGTVVVKEDSILSEDFENGQTAFTGRVDAKVIISSDIAYEGSKSLQVTERTATWDGAIVDLTDRITDDKRYKVEAYVYYTDGPDTVQFDCKVLRNDNEYLSFATSQPKKGEWTYIEGIISIPAGTRSARVYFETGYGGNDTTFINHYIDNIKISEYNLSVDRGDIPVLKDVYKDNFSMGVAITPGDLTKENNELILQQFNSITAGNEFKPDYILDYNTSISDPKYDDNPAVYFHNPKPLLDFAKQNNISMRGHTLVWHAQTPRWFFAVNYSKDEKAPLVSKELMLKRLENYIRQVMEFTNENYPGVIYAWDVVNEAIEPGDGKEGGYRSTNSLWYETIGPEFLEKSFEYARKYADPNVKLFYNDYNTEDTAKMMDIYNLVKKLKEKNIIDGIGLQSHIGFESPSIIKIQDSIMKYSKLGLELHITELDMGMTDNTEEALMKQAIRYKRLFLYLKDVDNKGLANITNVTFWGLSDDLSWLNKPGQPSYPLLFDKFRVQKPAFWGVALSKEIPLY